MAGPGDLVNVLREDVELARCVPGRQLPAAERDAVAPVRLVDAGEWTADERTTGALGWLVLEGVLVRSVAAGGRHGLELFGPGDLVRPHEPVADVDAMVPAEARWSALAPTRVAVLDPPFTTRICAYPEVIDELAGRIERRCSAQALRLAIMQQPRLSERLRLLLWHLADRFGRVQRDGLLLPLQLSHGLLADLVGAQRPSASRALKELESAGLVARRPDRSWWLRRAQTEDSP